MDMKQWHYDVEVQSSKKKKKNRWEKMIQNYEMKHQNFTIKVKVLMLKKWDEEIVSWKSRNYDIRSLNYEK